MEWHLLEYSRPFYHLCIDDQVLVMCTLAWKLPNFSQQPKTKEKSTYSVYHSVPYCALIMEGYIIPSPVCKLDFPWKLLKLYNRHNWKEREHSNERWEVHVFLAVIIFSQTPYPQCFFLVEISYCLFVFWWPPCNRFRWWEMFVHEPFQQVGNWLNTIKIGVWCSSKLARVWAICKHPKDFVASLWKLNLFFQ